MATLLAVGTAAAGLYCLGRLVLPVPHAEDHPRDLDAWHAVMAGVMAVMLVASTSRTTSVVALTAFVVGLAWALAHLVRAAARPAYLRLGIGCAAMVAMLLPAATATAAPEVAGATDGHHSHAGPTGPGAGPLDPTAPPAALLVGLLVALGVVLLLRLVRSVRTRGTPASRLDACCDVVMTTAAGYMLVLML